MDIYIGNLPEQLNTSQLNKIVKYALLPTSLQELLDRWIKGKGRIQHTDVEVIDDHRGNYAVRYGHAVITPDPIARRVVQRLDHLTLAGSSLHAREYVERNPGNDRRHRRHKNLYAVSTYNRRRGERRKPTGQ
ncbi:MAG: hypothetical protein PVJ39_03045 [Gammaproteobacteria bacterium]|jgi:hypothetical protein